MSGQNGVITQFMVWQLVDRYQITDAEGAPFSDPNYELSPDLIEIRGGKAIKATDFEL